MPGIREKRRRPKATNSIVAAWTCGVLFLAIGACVAFGQARALKESTQALNRGEYQKASDLASAHLRQSPGNLALRIILARAQIFQGQLDQAFDNLRKAVTSDPKNVDALFYLSVVAKELSKQENQRLFSLAPDSDRVHQILGEAALEASKQDEAQDEFEKALKIRPNSPAVLVHLAELKRSQFKFDEAISDYLQAERLDPGAYEVAYGLGTCYVSKREFSRAIETLQKAAALSPKSAAGRFALGNALFQDGQFEAAVPELNAALEIDPGTNQAYSLLARALAKLGRTEEADIVLQKLKRLNRTQMHEEGKPDSEPAVEQR
jgi:tetratricopeptide (TPR) repeat protein